MKTMLLLFSSNIFMTFAWYWHLNNKDISLWKAILISWGIAFFEYCLTVPANRLGFFNGGFSGFQLKIVQEAITLTIFTVFAVFYLKEPFHWRYFAGFALILLAVYVMFKK
ncbi:MAG TPA: DMT family protein [Puia sp.]|nr:DMT family protein [Puia sp.]